jgi:monoamine oxidase
MKRQRPVKLKRTRVVVLGAGMSGLACARELQHRGYEVLVVEARDRVGGRLKGHALHTGQNSSAAAEGSTPDAATSMDTANGNTATTGTANIDLGGALIHGIDDNPVAALTQQLGVTTKAVADCLLLDQSGWPVDSREDDRVSSAFNECLEATFQRAATASATEKNQPFGNLFTTVRAERQNQKNSTSATTSTTAATSGSSLNNSALWKWHQSNLEVSCGASFPDLGYQWNEDEPYGFDGDHVALKESWKAVTESMSENLDILYQSPVQNIHVVYPKVTAKSVTTKKAVPTTPSATPLAAAAAAAASTTAATPTTPATTTTPTSNKKKKKDSTTTPSSSLIVAAISSPVPERHSRRLRGEDAGASARRSSHRKTKGVAVDRFTVDHSSLYTRNAKRLKNNDGSDNGENGDITTDTVITAATGPRETVVQVTLQNGTVLEADHVVCTLPLGILKTDTVQFDPPLPAAKQNAVKRLGTGLLNKCAIAFSHVFWQDVDFLGLARDEHSYLVLNGASYTKGQAPVLIFMYGGAFAADIESWTDTEIVQDCLSVLKTICGRQIPTPSDYFVTRWGKEEYSRMAFTYIPPGVDGFQELQAMSQPICTFDANASERQVPVVMFAGEHTTPYHPSTIHGAFLSGIREAYRLDLLLEPAANDNLVFSDDQLYQRTFPIKRKFGHDTTAQPVVAVAAVVPKKETAAASTTNNNTNGSNSNSNSNRTRHRRRGAAGVMTLRSKPKSLSVVEPVPPPARKQPPNGITHEPTRRSQRSLAVQKSPNSVNGLSYGDSPSDEVTKEPARDLDAMEDRVLLRGVESYGRDFAYIQTAALPIFGSSHQRSLVQVRQRCQKLIIQSKKGKGTKSTRAWKTWVAKIVFPSAPKSKGTRPVANENTQSNTTNVAALKSRSGRTVKPRFFLNA